MASEEDRVITRLNSGKGMAMHHCFSNIETIRNLCRACEKKNFHCYTMILEQHEQASQLIDSTMAQVTGSLAEFGMRMPISNLGE